MKKAIAVLLALTMIFSLTACGGSSAGGSGKEKVLNIAYHATLTSLNPFQTMSEGMGPLSLYGYQPLFYKSQYVSGKGEINGSGLYPGVGKTFTKTDDLTYDVEIFDYVVDSEGNKITADDVVFSVQECMAEGNLVMQIGTIESIEKTGDYSVRFHMVNSQAGAFNNSVTQIGIVSKAAFEKYNGFVDATETVSTSPYLIKNFVSGSTYEFVKNDKYWQKDDLRTMFDETNVDRVVMTGVVDAATRAGLVESGAADWASRVDQSQLYLFENNSKFNLFSIPNSLTYMLSFNMGGSRVDSGASIVENNQKLREAIFTAIDCNALVASVALGNGAVTHAYGNESYPDYLKKWDSEPYFDYDKEKAKSLLAESGYNGETITLLTTNNTIWSKIAEVIQGCLLDVGIKCELNTVDDAVFVPTRNSFSGWDVTVDNKGAGDYITSIFKYSFDQDTFGGITQCGYSDEDMQVLLRAALEEKTHNADTADAFHQYLKGKAISRGLYYDYYNYAASKNVKDNPLSDKCFLIFGHAQYDDGLFK